jgi:Bacterial Ig domain
MNSDGFFTYTPSAGFAGTDSFKYACPDAAGTRSLPTTLTITVS